MLLHSQNFTELYQFYEPFVFGRQWGIDWRWFVNDVVFFVKVIHLAITTDIFD